MCEIECKYTDFGGENAVNEVWKKCGHWMHVVLEHDSILDVSDTSVLHYTMLFLLGISFGIRSFKILVIYWSHSVVSWEAGVS